MWRVLRSEIHTLASALLVDAWSVQRERVFAFENRIPGRTKRG